MTAVNWHRFRFGELRLVLDVASGALHVLDEVAWEVVNDFLALGADEAALRWSGTFGGDQVAGAIRELTELEQRGVLASHADEEAMVAAHLARRPVVKALCLHLAHACNLACRYCFADAGRFGGQAGLMTDEVARRALDLLFDQSEGRRRLEVDFFGGEPLLNFDVLRRTVAYGRAKAAELGKTLKFTVTTNGTLLDEEIGDYLNRENIDTVLSLDGRPQVNDAMRTDAAGRGSYEQIMPRLRRFTASRQGRWYYVRGTFTRWNLDFAEDVRHLADAGFATISMEPVVTSPDVPYALAEEDVPRILAEYERLAELYRERRRQGRPFGFYHFNLDLGGGPCLSKRLSGCGAGYEYVAVAPDGTIYPCHQFVGRPGFTLGDVERGITNTALAEEFRHTHVLAKDECRTCWARFLCSGGCHANNHLINGTIKECYALGCMLQRKRIEIALGLAAEEAIERQAREIGPLPARAPGGPAVSGAEKVG